MNNLLPTPALLFTEEAALILANLVVHLKQAQRAASAARAAEALLNEKPQQQEEESPKGTQTPRNLPPSNRHQSRRKTRLEWHGVMAKVVKKQGVE